MAENSTGRMRSPFLNAVPDMEVNIKTMEKHIFYYGKGMQNKCIQSSKAYLDYVGWTYGESERQSILTNTLIVSDAQKPKPLATQKDYDEMLFSERKLWDKQADNWFKSETIVRRNLSKAYSVLWTLCHIGLQQKIMSDKDFKNIESGDAAELYRIVQKICHGNSSTENPFTNLMEAWYNFLLVRGDTFESLSIYLESFQKRSDVVEKCGGHVCSTEFRDLYMKELETRDQHNSNIYRMLLAWKLEEQWKSTGKDQTPPREAEREAIAALREQYRAYVYIKRAGPRYEYYRSNLHNNYNEGIATYPPTVTSAHNIMDHHKNMQMQTNRSTEKKDTERGQTYQQEDFNSVPNPAVVPDSEQARSNGTGTGTAPADFEFKTGVICFRCDREGHLTKECWFAAKENGEPVNNKEVIDEKYKQKLASRKKNRKAGPAVSAEATTTVSSNFIDTETIPTVEEYLEVDRDDDERNRDEDYAFIQYSTSHRSVSMDVSKMNHVYNQTSSLKCYEVLFDSCSTCDIFVNRDFLRDIRDCRWTLLLKTQAGECRVNKIGDLPGVGTVWYYPDGSANILSAHRMVIHSGWSVNYSTDKFLKTNRIKDLAYECTTNEGVKVCFRPTKQGLYIMDCSKYFEAGVTQPHVFGKLNTDNGTHYGLAMCERRTLDDPLECKQGCYIEENVDFEEAIDTIEKSKQRFSKRDRDRAETVRRFQHVAGHPSNNTLMYAAATNSIKNSPITRRDITLALDMLGKSEYAVRGKTTGTQSEAVTEQLVEVPRTIINHYRNVELSADVLHVNKIPFLATLSRHIHYTTIGALDDMKMVTLEKTFQAVLRAYRVRGFNVVTVHVDIQFKAMKDQNLLGIRVNVVSKEEHVPDIERLIRVIKERARSYYAMLPFDFMPQTMVIHLLTTVVFYINAFVWREGVSQFLPPITIVEGLPLDFNKHFHLIFGEYVHTYEGTTNDMKERTVGAIALGPSGNFQGGIRCYSLLTGKVLLRTIADVTRLKMPQEAIRRLTYRAKKQKAAKGLEFADRHGNVDAESTIITRETEPRSPEIQTAGPADIAIEEEGNDDHDVAHVEEGDEGNPIAIPDADTDTAADRDVEGNDEPDADETVEIAPENRNDEVDPPEGNDDSSDSDGEEESEEDQVTTRSGRVVRAYDYKEKFPEIYGESNYTIDRLTQEEYQLYSEALEWYDYSPEEITALVFKASTMSVKQGIKKHGGEAKASAMKEVRNLVDNECFGELDYSTLTQEMKDKALPILMFMVLKRNGVLKTRGVADGSVQRLFTNKDDESSPTPDFYAFKYICAIIAKEARDVATVDLPGFFLQTEQEGEELILLKLTGEVALLLVECDPNRWKKHLRKENGKWIIYVICKKAIYGTMNAALLAYKKLAKLWKQWGLVMNPYDPCVWNADIQGSQFTVVFHIDDLLMSHRSATVVTDMIKKLDREYGTKDDLTVTRGRVHEYLGMTIDFTVPGECAFSQFDYIKKMISLLPDSLKVNYRNTPAPEYLFKIDENSEPLDMKRKDEYHALVAKILWASQRSRPDIQLATGFHCTRVKDPREHDWRKLEYLLGYIKRTRFLPLIISVTDAGTFIYIDGAHAVHTDAKGHSGLFVTQGRGAMISVSKKLGVLTTSSTETEIVSAGERLPKCTWFRYFRIAQGEEVKEDILLQDNKSAIILQKNYPYSTRKGSKHIHVRYFFVVDKIEKKEIKILYCPTDEMIADYNSKPLQGQLFIHMRNLLLGIKPEDFDEYKRRYRAILEKYELFDGGCEDDLHHL